MNLQRWDKEEVHIFWDYDTTRTSSASNAISIYDVVKNIRTAVNPFGPLKSFRAYSDFSGFSLPRSANFRSELSSSGVTLIDCPGDGRKDLSTKILLVDLFINAWDNPPPRTFVIITGDRDLAYAVSILRTRNFRVVVICPATTHVDLTAQASAQLDWSRVVLGISGELPDFKPTSAPPKEPSLPSFMARRQTSETANDTQTGSSLQKSFLGETQPIIPTAISNPEPPIINYQDRLPRARRNSLFSTYDSSQFNVFEDDLDTELATPTAGIGSFGLGDGPLFSRPRSRAEEQSRADSAPPNIQYSTTGSTPHLPSSYLSFTEPEIVPEIPEVPPLTLKGKQKEKEIQSPEPERALPDAPQEIQPLPQAIQEPIMAPSPTNIMYSDSIFEPFGGSAPFTNPAYTPSNNPSGTPPLIRSMSSLSTTSQTSLFSTMMHIEEEDFSAPTSAETQPFVEKSDSTIKPLNVEKSSSPPRAINGTNKSLPSSRPSSMTLLASPKQVPAPFSKTEEKAPVKAASPARVHVPVQTSPPKPVIVAVSTKVPVASAFNKAPAPSKASSSNVPVPKTKVTPAPSTTPSSLKVPSQFVTLVNILREEQKKHVAGITRSTLGAILPKKDPAVYRVANCSKFSQYVVAALAAGVIEERLDNRGEPLVALSSQYA